MVRMYACACIHTYSYMHACIAHHQAHNETGSLSTATKMRSFTHSHTNSHDRVGLVWKGLSISSESSDEETQGGPIRLPIFLV